MGHCHFKKSIIIISIPCLFLGGYFSPGNCQVNEYDKAVASLNDKITVLENLIKEAESKGIDVSYQKVSLAVGKIFVDFIPKDAKLTIENFPSRWVDYRILGKEELVRRMKELPGFEAKETEKILNKAINDVNEIIKDPSKQIRVPSYKVGKVSTKNGVFQVDGKPIFISGIYSTNFVFSQTQYFELLRNLGSNLIGYLGMRQEISKGWDEFDNESFYKDNLPQYKSAEKENFFVITGEWHYPAPDWLAKIAPDINLEDKNGWFRTCIDLDNPLTEKYKKSWFRNSAILLKDIPNNIMHSLMGEEWCNSTFRGKYTAERYANWLKNKHKDINGLNKAWGTNYKSFDEATDAKSTEIKGGNYDWHTYNQYRLTTFNQWQADAIREKDPTALFSFWPAAGGLVSAPLGAFDSYTGRNREDILNQSSLMGWDGGIFASEAGQTTRRLPESHWNKYNSSWRDEMIYYDFAKSLSPDKAIFDHELHTLTSVYHMTPMGITPDYFRTTFWMEHLHGMSGQLFWWWGRNINGGPNGEFLGGLMTQPQLVDIWGKTALEMRRLIDYITLFPQLERKVRILYSEPSSIQDKTTYTDELNRVYESCYFLDYQVGFITEKMIKEGKLKDCSILIIPNARYVNEEAVSKIKEYLKKKDRVLIVGKESLQFDEYGNSRDISEFAKKAIYLNGTTAEEYSPQIDNSMEKIGIKRSVRAFDKDGKNAWGVELRTAVKNGKKIIYLINVKKDNAEIVLKSGKKEIQKVKDLVDNKEMQMTYPYVVEPRKPVLLEILE